MKSQNTTACVLLLRGVNVGGKNKVPMKGLTGLLIDAGFTGVHSYINSGNILLCVPDTLSAAKTEIRALLDRHYGPEIPMLLLTGEAYRRETALRPAWWREPLARRDVLFLMDDADPALIRTRIEAMPLTAELVSFGERAVFWGKTSEKDYARTAYHRFLLKEPFYPQITIRNGNTFDRLAELLEQDEVQV